MELRYLNIGRSITKPLAQYASIKDERGDLLPEEVLAREKCLNTSFRPNVALRRQEPIPKVGEPEIFSS
jgi:hypothetical protein